MAQVVKDLLSTTSLLFDKSDALNDELQRLVKSAQRTSTQKDQEELTKVVVAGLDTSSVSMLNAGAGGEGGLTVLQRALADCEAAAASIKKLHENRDAVVDARAEAIKVQEQLARDKAEKLADEISQSTKCVCRVCVCVCFCCCLLTPPFLTWENPPHVHASHPF